MKIEESLSRKCQTAEQWCNFFLAHDFDGYFTITGENVDLVFGEVKIPLKEMVEEMKNVTESFPDLSVRWNPCRETDDGKVITTIVVSGTHTGKPYGFGPYPKIEATGIKCQNDSEEVTFTFGADDKISLIETKPLGKFGPTGFYSQIGGFPLE